MKSENIFLIALLVVLIGGLAFAFTGSNKNIEENSVMKTVEKEETGFKKITTGSTGMGDVEIELKPLSLENGKLLVDFAANTHSVSLSQFDLMEITTLEYDKNIIRPVEALSLGGHHSFGELVFDVDKDIKEFTITIEGIPKVEKRIFSWG